METKIEKLPENIVKVDIKGITKNEPNIYTIVI